MDGFIYDLALSFAGENRDIAEAIARQLDASGYAVFYDAYQQDQLWGSDLTEELGAVYGEQARFCLMIVSQHYINKMWTKHERRYAISRLLSRGGDYILQLKVDESEVPGLPPTIAYLSLKDKSLEEVYQILLRKLGPPQVSTAQTNRLSAQDVNQARAIIEACYRRAVFTRMDSEIDLGAMFSSLSDSLHRVQVATSRLRDPGLQRLAEQVMRCLDKLERVGHRYRYESAWSFDLPQEEKQRIEALKLQLIDALLALRRSAGIAMTLPTSLNYDHFYRLEDANRRPDEW